MNKLFVEASPHIRSSRTTQNIMLDVVIALCPALIAATIIFGIKALVLTSGLRLYAVLAVLFLSFCSIS